MIRLNLSIVFEKAAKEVERVKETIQIFDFQIFLEKFTKWLCDMANSI